MQTKLTKISTIFMFALLLIAITYNTSYACKACGGREQKVKQQECYDVNIGGGDWCTEDSGGSCATGGDC